MGPPRRRLKGIFYILVVTIMEFWQEIVRPNELESQPKPKNKCGVFQPPHLSSVLHVEKDLKENNARDFSDC